MSSLFKKSEEHFCQSGLAELSQRRLAEAAAEFSKGLKAYPNSFALHANRSNVWLLSGDFARAAADLTAALKSAPPNAETWPIKLKRGTCYVRTEQIAQAIKDLDEALAAAPRGTDSSTLADGYFFRALAWMEQDSKKALADAEKAVELAPGDGRYRKLMADLEVLQSPPEVMRLGQEGAQYLQAGQDQQALSIFDQLLAIEPNNAKAWQMKGHALHKLERYEEELAALDRSYSINGNEVALFNRAACYVALGRTPEAKRDLTKFIEVGAHSQTIAQAKVMLATL